MLSPSSAIIAVTLNCNSRCIMCNIWQNHIKGELDPKEFLKLPSTLTDINITGGEPFLRSDLDEIVKNMKIAAPRARLILNTNGFMPHRIGPMMKKILAIDPNFAFRVSIDGIGKAHDDIRRFPDGFNKILKTIETVRALGAKDMGVSFTLGNYNMNELAKVQNFCRKNRLEFSLTVATGSVIYFGKDKQSYRPTDMEKTSVILTKSAQKHLSRFEPKEIVRGWFVKRLLQFMATGKRALPCDAGKGFFYMDSVGNVYTCHIKPWVIGNIRTSSIETILSNHTYDDKVTSCNDCWMVCTVKTMMRKRIFRIALECMTDKISATLAQ
jgi:Fe-coproporphyrin III synthase